MNFLASGNDLPHPKKVWKHLIRAVRLKLSRLARVSKSISSIKRRNNLSHYSCATRRCRNRHHQQHHLPVYHSTKPRQLAQTNHGCSTRISDVGASRKSLANHYDERHRFDDDDDGEVEKEDDQGVNDHSAPENEEGIGENRRMALQLHVVDIRAEEFIEKFHERLRLERQRSAEEYLQMLCRGV
ncbi:hypothetical protein TorRG33x02_122210 [Trema orientale]|uniref:Uncharacterized protein n=1 Tax=Trema orientale TaxID=63057 RepID=A0A2P5F265_TREOI|nr:hypothetical protein TorRG33x02_122210 [Trema orientale]